MGLAPLPTRNSLANLGKQTSNSCPLAPGKPNAQIWAANLLIRLQAMAVPNGGYWRAYHVVSVPPIIGVPDTIASVACIFMQAIVFRERAHMPRLGERSRPQLPCRCRRRQRSGAEASLQVGVGDRTVKEAERSGVKQLPAGALDRA